MKHMTFEDYLVLVEEGLRSNDGFWNEAEAQKVMPVKDVTAQYIQEKSDEL